ncbi:conserved hypothetical protein [Pediculus humanus corporis]|uniref:Rho GTPase-activating protein 21 n=1 Tax=Pediculus humanus subsp. corporis TaxID=121224 RepID=E0VFY7_PEDHC|nr:uncharacterized protein Phum_PHUM169920 [Pediculus humanus corporis]EEB12293.1 conserved hypothetical protein [Pediculus humanus corporis]
MAKEKRLGLRQGNANLNEPMDTIFVKAVHEGTSAHAAGLETGDRILSVNGETIAGKTYAQVVQQIHNTPERLNLLVVPKEEDIIQQYYSETAHNPKTNARPRLRSPEVVQDPKRASALSLPGTQRNMSSQKMMMSPVRQQQSPPVFGSWQHGMHSSNPETVCNNSLMWPNQSIGSENRGTMEMHRLKMQNSRWGNSGSGKVQTDQQISVIKTNNNPATFYSNASGCRLSLDGGTLDRRESSSSSTLTDDSVIMSRIRKSCEQKEEFLRNTATPLYSQIIAREFYARPQKFQKQIWPPNSPPPPPPSESEDLELKSAVGDDRPSLKSGQLQSMKTLSRVQDGSPKSFPSETLDGETCETPQSWHDSPKNRSHSEESDSARHVGGAGGQRKLHIVSQRAKQFETGQLEEEENKTHFYRSELARLSGKKTVPNVAVRKQEFERVGRDGNQSGGKDFCSSAESFSSSGDAGGILSGNRTVIVGSKQIHVDPPTDFKQLGPEVENQDRNKENVSKTSKSWTSLQSNPSKEKLILVETNEKGKEEERQRHKAVRQDSYLAAVKPVSSNAGVHNNAGSQVTEVVVRREKNSTLSSAEDDRATRRISYLKATSNDQMNIGLDKDSDRSTVKRKWMYPMLPGDIQRLRRIFEEYSGIVDTGSSSNNSNNEGSSKRHTVINIEKSELNENLKIIKDGWLNCKVAVIDGKRAGDRSWKQIWAILRGPYLTTHKDKQAEQAEYTIDIRSCTVDIPQNYTKKKNVFKIKTESETEYWLQAEDQDDLDGWIKILDEQSENSNTLSPQAVHKGIKKLGNLRTRSPTGQSPASKTRKATQLEQPVSPKSKTWKGKLGKQFKKMQGSGGSPSSPTISYPEGATIKVPIELCPPSTISEYIPLIVEKCTSIVESRGLEVVGIYRIPGNTAAVTALTEAVNKGIDSISPEDPRWNDINVISSLLKSFFRNLPDSLFTAELYPKFIEADKIVDPKVRMVTLRKLIKELPEHNFETLKHLLYHLKKIVSKSSVNKMETQNLAIVFGPTLLTTTDLMALVTDTSHQCRIVESLITHVDWFFSNDDVNTLENLTPPMSSSDAQVSSETPPNANLLLGNIHKIEGYSRLEHSPNKDMSPKDIVSSIISAANRKISKGKSKKVDKTVTQIESETKTVTKKTELIKEEELLLEPSTSVAASIVSSFVGEILRNKNGDISKSSTTSDLNSNDVIRAYSGLDSNTIERIKRFEQETHAMLQRDPTKTRRGGDTETNWLSDKQIIEMKLQQAKRELENEEDVLDALTNASTDLTKKSNSDRSSFSSHAENNIPSTIRKGGLYENEGSDPTTTPNSGSLKRFKSNRDESNEIITMTSSLDSLHDAGKSDTSDDGNDLVLSLTKTFDKTLKSVLNMSDDSSLEEEKKSMTEKAEYENVIENKESKLCGQNINNNNNNNNNNNEKKMGSENDEWVKDEEESKKSCVKSSENVKTLIKEKNVKKTPEIVAETVLRAKNTENASNLKRSESLNKPEKPDSGCTKLKRSESLNKNEKENDFIKLKHSDSLKNDLKRSDSLTKYEKTETNMNKRKQQESGLKRSSSKEKENVLFVKLKRKNGMPDRSIKRRHTVGGTKDFDKLPWLDNRLQCEESENEKSLKSKEKRSLRTSSPDLSSSRLKATIESEGLSIEVSLLGSRGNVLATLRKPLIPPSPSGRPQSMPPVSQIFKLPLESHV